MGKKKWKKKTRLCDCPIAAQVNPLVTPSHHAVNSVAKRMHGCGTRLKPLSPPLSRYVLATCPCTSSSLAFSFPFPPKREDPEKRHTGNPVRHNCPKTLLMSRGRKLTNADPNLYIRSGISNFPCIFFMSYQGTSPEAGLVSPLFSQTWQMVGISFGEKKGVGGGMCFGRKEGTTGRMYV